MKKRLSFLVILFILTPVTISMAVPIPSEVKAVVAFIFVPGEKGPIPHGTGFFVGVKNPRSPRLHFTYLVTAKHVLQKRDKTLFPFVFVRLNKKEGEAEMLPLPIGAEGSGKNLFIHKDPSVDLAVIPAVPDENKYASKFLPEEFITTKEDFQKLNIREGSDVFFTGLFLSHIGEHRNYPIVRFGRVALVTAEKINWEGVNTDLYLIECGSYGGNSGSPVFFYLGAEREPGSINIGAPILKLAGIMKGSFGEGQPIQVIEASKTLVAPSNIGIASVVPAYKLQEILFGEELKKQRNF